MAVINGTAGNNVLIGTDLDDVISGFGGDDFIQGTWRRRRDQRRRGRRHGRL
ncbi:hypothetical protein Q1M64_15610 (plasmid) [Sinorhizobium meliloti]|nr:hypothetical protein Q1M64_15610 [Sinorhizobium meliloti]